MGMMQQMFASFQTTAGAPGVTTDALFAYVSLLLNGDSGVAFNADASTNNFALSPVANVRNDIFSPFRTDGYYSNYFNGSAKLGIATNAVFGFGTADFTVELWINCAFNGAVQEMIDARASDVATPWVFGITGTGLARTYDGATARTGGQLIANTWNHVAWVRASNVNTVYVNGVSGHTWTATQDFGSTKQIIIGDNVGPTSEPLTGYISNLRIVKGVAVYTGTFTPSTSPLAITQGAGTNISAITGTSTSLLTCQSSRFKDNTANNLSFNLTGTPAVKPAIPFTYTDTSGSARFTTTADSINAPVTTAMDFGTSAVCLEAWVYLVDGTITYLWATTAGASGQTRPNFGVSSATFSADYFGNSFLNGSATMPINVWNHVAFTRDTTNTGWRYFINGVLKGYTATANQNLLTTTVAQKTFGLGSISNLRIIIGSVPAAYQTASTTIGTVVFTPSTTPLTAVANTVLLTLQNTLPANNKGFFDNSQFDVLMTPAGTPTQGTFTPFSQTGWSGLFDGSVTAVSLQNSALLQPGASAFTVECWVFPKGSQANNYIYGDCDSSTNNGGIAITLDASNKLMFIWYTNATTVATFTSTAAVVPNIWNHIAISKSSTTAYLCINGVAEAATVISTIAAGANPTIGRQGAYVAAARVFNGFISNFRFLKGTALYSANFTPPSSPLTAIANTSILTLQNNRLIDNSGNNLTQTIATPASTTFAIRPISPFEPATSYSAATNGASLYFAGAGNWLSTPASANITPTSSANWTLECWVYPLSYAVAPMIFSIGTYNSAINIRCSLTTSGFIDCVSGSGTWAYNTGATASTNAVPLNTWSHLAWVRTGTTLTMYVNGILTTTAASFNFGSGNTGTISITGYFANATVDQCLNGYMADLRYVTSSLYSATFTPPTAPLTAITGTQMLLSGKNTSIVDSAAAIDVISSASAQTSLIQKKFGTSSMKFTAGDYLSIPVGTPGLQFGAGNFTVEAWVNLASTSTSQAVLCGQSNNSTAAGSSFVFYVGGAATSDLYIGAAGYGVASPVPTANVWAHVAWVRNGTNYTTYLNGTAVATRADLGTSALNIGTTGFTNQIGAAGNGVNSQLTGYIDDLRVTKGQARYTANFTPPTAAFPTR